jgi:hypothetical protein
MYKKLLTVLAAVAVSSCAGPAVELNECSGVPKNITIHYDDSELRVTPPLRDNLARRGILRFRLEAGPGFEDKIVTITGKSGPSGSDVSWINASGSESSWPNRRQDICIEPSVVVGVYKYDVQVQDVGTLDPRADVER